MRIQKLSTIVANQIAAGEVVERPASVVKELVENSVDAGATAIEISIRNGGTAQITIRDNGCGIVKDDLALAISRHATSKIIEFSDLDGIESLGFRGEALASIASVSCLKIISCPAEQDIAYSIETDELRDSFSINPAAHPPGTTVEIRDLFYNTPARRKFLRAVKTEFTHIEAVVKRIALSCNGVQFTLLHDDKLVLQLPRAMDEYAREKRVAKILGKSFLEYAIAFSHQQGPLRLSGWVASPSFMRSQSDLQYIFVNGRVVRDKLLMRAIREAYADLLFPGRQPAYVLYLSCDPTLVDVNVHPTKHEVRFNNARIVHDFIVSALKRVIDSRPSIDRNEHSKNNAVFAHVNERSSMAVAHGITIIAGRYFLLAREDQQIFADSHAIAQQVCYKLLSQQVAQGRVDKRPLLVPITVSLSERDYKLWQMNADKISQHGLEIESWGENKVIIRNIPVHLQFAEIKPLVNAVLQELTNPQPKLLQTMASFNIPAEITPSIAQSLFERYESLQLPSKNFDGRSLLRIFSPKDLERLFDA